MKDEDIQNLLGGFATDTLTEDEREALYAAALKNQDLFNAMADEQTLRDFLSDPAARRRLLQLLRPESPGVFERLTSSMRRPAAWGIAGAVMTALIVAVVIRQTPPPAVQMAKAPAPALVASAPPKPAEEFRSLEDEVSARAREDPPATVPKMKVAVLDFDSGVRERKEAAAASADVGKTASDLLGKKLDSSGYEVIDRKQVDKALQEQNLSNRQLDAATAASLGRSVGADAVIVGSVQQAPVPAPSQQQAGGQAGGAPAPPPAARAKEAEGQQIAVNATAINVRTGARFGFAQGEVDQVASSLTQQIKQNTRVKIEGLVTDVNAAILTLNVGARAGVKPGDRLEVRRAGKAVGRVSVSSAKDAFSVGVFEGAEAPKIGDAVVNQ